MLGVSLLLWVVILHAQKVISRYNYYLPQQQGEVVCVLPDSNYQLILLKEGKTIATADVVRDHRLTAQIDLPVGTTSVQYQLLQNKQPVSNGTLEMVVLPAKPNTVQIDQLTGGLIADGLPFFPFGFYCVPVNNLPEREVVHGFNMIGPYQDNLPGRDRKSVV